jgi:hypothetical protein
VASKPVTATPAPTIALKTAGPTAPAPTIKLATSTKPFGATTSPALPTTQPLSTKPALPALAAATAALPKATVNLQPPTVPLGAMPSASASQAPTLMIAGDEETSSADKVVTGLAIVGFIAACALLAFQLMIAGIWINAEDNPSESGWMQLIE